MKRIHLISNPRNLSTALMYSFAQRQDCRVVDEPLYAYYLKLRPDVDHPGKEEIMNSMSSDLQQVIDEVFLKDYDRPVVFLKDMAHHLIEMPLDFMLSMTNLFLIRNPRQLIASIGKVMKQPAMEDIGSQQQYELYHWLKEQGQNPVVLDSGELLKDHESVMQKLCTTLDISFDPHMLTWEAGARPEDGVWAKYWYHNVHQTTGFSKQESSSRTLPEHLIPLYKEARPYYESLFQNAIKA
ncbi:sulfotransferase-like domain-containing protein [Catalinimonas niigatensis]|uniref:sulfotransferase-like domain-containing protein n=1 Tax=Catalinimonas niigatensis TaxID=1397264 RepID=UPI0026653E5A|nr:sulfotransferase family protein [Catalinimonas niigatensis]WPP52817.1 sulfotransferase family protein [Catalinimonas niigatensis]